VVVHHEDRALLDRQASERSIERVAIGNGQDRRRVHRPVDREDTDVGGPLPATPGLGVAGMDEQAADPGVEPIRVAQPRKLTPGGGEGVLQGVLGEMGIAQDPRRDRVQPVAGLRDQVPECLAIAAHRPLDDLSHTHLVGPASDRRSQPMSGRWTTNVHRARHHLFRARPKVRMCRWNSPSW
jgi:hypothetical protein